MVSGNRHFLVALVMVGAHGTVPAQALNEPSPVARVLGVTQFGVTRDAKYIFCDGDDCPDRTGKTLTSPTQEGRVVPEPMPQPQSMQPPLELMTPKAELARPHPPKPMPVKRKKRVIKQTC